MRAGSTYHEAGSEIPRSRSVFRVGPSLTVSRVSLVNLLQSTRRTQSSGDMQDTTVIEAPDAAKSTVAI